MKLRPIGDKIVVAKSKGDKTTKSGLVLLEQSTKNPTGKVVAIGSGRMLNSGTIVPFEVKVGDNVMFQTGNCTVEIIDGVEHFIMYESNILAVVEE